VISGNIHNLNIFRKRVTPTNVQINTYKNNFYQTKPLFVKEWILLLWWSV